MPISNTPEAHPLVVELPPGRVGAPLLDTAQGRSRSSLLGSFWVFTLAPVDMATQPDLAMELSPTLGPTTQLLNLKTNLDHLVVRRQG